MRASGVGGECKQGQSRGGGGVGYIFLPTQEAAEFQSRSKLK